MCKSFLTIRCPTRRLAAKVALVVLLGTAGYGGGDGRHHISGKVTYGGQPIAEGSISFDLQGGGGGSFAPIKGGTYDTANEGRSHSGGPHRVTIVGYKSEGKSRNPDADVVLLFQPYETKAELATKRSTMDFEIPASHGR